MSQKNPNNKRTVKETVPGKDELTLNVVVPYKRKRRIGKTYFLKVNRGSAKTPACA